LASQLARKAKEQAQTQAGNLQLCRFLDS